MATEFISQKNPGGIHTKNSFRKAWNSYFLAICGHLPTSCPFIFEKVGSKYEQIVNKTDKITPHMLRHTFCTMMHENWVDIKTAQQQMGHSDTKTTMNVYTHVTSQFEAKEMQKKWTFWPKFIQKSYKMGQKPRKIGIFRLKEPSTGGQEAMNSSLATRTQYGGFLTEDLHIFRHKNHTIIIQRSCQTRNISVTFCSQFVHI